MAKKSDKSEKATKPKGVKKATPAGRMASRRQSNAEAPTDLKELRQLEEETEEYRTVEQLVALANGNDGVEDEEHTITLSPEQADWCMNNGLDVSKEKNDTFRVNTMQLVEHMAEYSEQFREEDADDERTQEQRTPTGSETGDAV